MSTRAAFRNSATSPMLAIALLFLLAVSVGGSRVVHAQNVDWMSADQAAALDLTFPVMVPGSVPAPFSGSPSISGGGGYYSLYWVNYGGPPTFLQITGDVGGSLPAGSPADLNEQLSINASVQGSDAIHDMTSIYDNVWWISGDVLYTVSSNNMTGTDSLSLANSLIALQAPVAEEPEPPAEEPASEPAEEEEPQAAEPESDPGASVEEAEPNDLADEVDGGELVTETGPEASQGPDDAVGETQPSASADEEGEATDPEQDAVSLTPTTSLVTSLLTGAASPAVVDGESSLSDGTGGATLPSRGDGTGGARQITIP